MQVWPIRYALLLLASLIFAFLGGLTSALGQFRNGVDPDDVPDVFVPASRDLQLQLSRARKALTEGSFVDAADLLGSLIAAPEADRFSPDAEDYFLDAAEAGGTFRSLKSEVLKLLGGMPREGREAYEIRYGAEARSLVDAAIETGDIEKLTEAARMYFHTRAGYEAMLLLARYHLIQGRPLSAALCAQRVVEAPAASSCEPEASILLAGSWWNAGYPDRAKTTLIGLRKKAPQAQIRIDGKLKPLFTSDARALDWLAEIMPDASSPIASAQDNWVMHRGDPSRNAESKGSAPVRTPIWQALPVFDPDDEAILRDVERGFREQPGSVALLSVLHPLAVGEDVIMRLPDRVVALDFTTGKAKWEYPWDDTARSVGPSLESSRNQTSDRDRRRRFLTRRIWEDAAHGQLTSDGEYLYFLDGLEIDMFSRFSDRIMNLRNPRVHIPGSANTLVCLELQSEGRQKWVVGGASGEDEPRLAGAWFLGAPLAMQGQVYVLAEITGEIRLVVLDADSGQLQWWQQLCQIDDFAPIANDHERKLVGCTPSFADGVLVCPTSAGAVVAVDIATRSLIWGHRYQTAMQRKTNLFNASSQNELGKRWADCTVTIAEGKALVCSSDSNELHCLDLLTGKRAWGPIRRNDALYVACVREGAAFIVQAESMTALRMTDGVLAWKSPLSLKGMRPSGRGFVDGEHYFLPVENSQILKINLAKGEIVDRVATAFPLGNLVCHRDAVIAQSTKQWLSMFHQLDPLRANVAKRLAADPEDAWALARQGEILAHDGKPREAIAALRMSLAKEPKSRSARAIMARTMLSLLREDFNGNPDLARDATMYVDRPEDRAELLQLELNGLIKANALSEAFDRLMLLVIDSERPGIPSTNELIEPPGEAARRVTRERWQRGLLMAMWSKGSAELRQKMQARFAREAAKIDASAGSERLTRFVELFGGFPGAETPLVELIKLETLASNNLRAEMLLELLRQYDSAIAQVTADALTLELGLASNQSELAAQAFASLQKINEPLTLLDGRELRSLLANIRPKVPTIETPTKPVWPQGAVLTEQFEDRSVAMGAWSANAMYRVRMPNSHDLPSISVARTEDVSILVRDRFGIPQTRLELDRLVQRVKDYPELRHTARVRGNFLLVSQGFQLLAIDLHRGAAETDSVMQWNLDLIPRESSSFQGAAYGQRTMPLPNRSPLEGTPPRSELVYSSVDRMMGQTSDLRLEGVCFHRGLKLICVAPISGKVLWERSDVPMGHDLFANESTLLVADRDVQIIRRFQLTDGSELAPARLEEGERVWAGLGANVLTSQLTANGEILVRLWNLANDTPDLLWKEQMPAKSVGCVIDGVEVGLLDPAGKLVIYPLDGGREPIRQTIDVSEGMTAMTVQRSADAYFVHVHQPLKQSNSSGAMPMPLKATELFHGQIHALRRENGESMWPSPARIEQTGMLSETAADSPVLVYVKAVKRGTSTSRLTPSVSTGSLLVIDKATGRNLYEKSDIYLPNLNPYCRVEVNPKTYEVKVFLTAQTFGGIKLSFTNDPRPPEPPAQNSTSSSMAPVKP
jgi:outer membrane protein assembly factor BamB